MIDSLDLAVSCVAGVAIGCALTFPLLYNRIRHWRKLSREAVRHLHRTMIERDALIAALSASPGTRVAAVEDAPEQKIRALTRNDSWNS